MTCFGIGQYQYTVWRLSLQYIFIYIYIYIFTKLVSNGLSSYCNLTGSYAFLKEIFRIQILPPTIESYNNNLKKNLFQLNFITKNLKN